MHHRNRISSRTAKLLQGNHALVKLFVFSDNDLLVVTFSDNHTSVTPTKVVHAPEGVDWQEETVNWVSVPFVSLESSHCNEKTTYERI